MNQVTMDLYDYNDLLIRAKLYDENVEKFEKTELEKVELREMVEVLERQIEEMNKKRIRIRGDKERSMWVKEGKELPDEVQIQHTPYGQEIMLCGKRIKVVD